MATQFQTYSKKFLDEKVAYSIDVDSTTTPGTIVLQLKNNKTTPTVISSVELGTIKSIAYVNTTTNPTSLEVEAADGTKTYVKLTGLATLLEEDLTGAKTKLEIKDVDGTVLDTVEDIVFADVSQTLKNKTIDCSTGETASGGNTITNLVGSDSFKAQSASDEHKTWVVKNDGTWELGYAGQIDSVTSDDTVVKVDTTDSRNPKLSANISATQGTGVTVSKETDGLKVKVQDGTTAQKGIVQLTSTNNDSDETMAITPKGANVTLEEQGTAESGFLKTYVLKQNGNVLKNPDGNEVKINIPKDFLVKSGRVVSVVDYAVATAYTKGDVINNTTENKTYYAKENITVDENTEWSAITSKVTEYDSVLTTGDKVISLIVNTKDTTEGSADNTVLIIPASGLVDVYTAGNGIIIDSDNFIIVKPKIDAGIDVDSDGVSVKFNSAKAVEVTSNGVGVVVDNTKAIDYTTDGKLGVIVDTDNAMDIDTTKGLKVKVDTAKALQIDTTNGGIGINNGDGLEFDSNKVKVKPKTDGALGVTSDGVAVLVDNTKAIEITSDNKLGVKVDASTIDYSSTDNKLEVKDKGVAEVKLTDELRQKLYEVSWTEEDGVIKFTSLA